LDTPLYTLGIIFFSSATFTPTAEERCEVERLFTVDGCGNHLVIPENFSQTVIPFSDGSRTNFSSGSRIGIAAGHPWVHCSKHVQVIGDGRDVMIMYNT
jgi:hypothetical protein